jgi:predicted membrane chloride channel (bestrophin family)
MNSAADSILSRVPARWRLAVKVVPIVALLAFAKLIIHLGEADFIELTTLLGSVVAATLFLLAFLLAGTLTDYKESERLPGELAASIESLADECAITLKNKGGRAAEDAVLYIADFAAAVHRWFYREERTRAVMDSLTDMNDLFLGFESLTQPNFIVRMKQEQSTIRRIITRIDTIRDTSFVSAGYTIAELATALLFIGLLLTDIEPFYEALFYIVAIGFFMTYLIALIRDLDNPFDYGRDAGEAAEVSIKPIADLAEKLGALATGVG